MVYFCCAIDKQTKFKTMKKLILILTCLSGIANAQVVAIPDPNFKGVLLYKYDFNHDNQIQNSEVDTVNTLNIVSMSISDLTGIEAFTGLVKLWCNNNLLTSINVTQNTQLFRLTCSGNFLSTVNTSMNPSLQFFDAPNNHLTNLDFSANSALVSVICSQNYLTTLDFRMNPSLQSIDAGGNQITSVNLDNNTLLTFLRIWQNNLLSLDLRLNPALNYVQCGGNPNLVQICVTPSQYFNSSSQWGKDVSTSWNHNCVDVTGINESDLKLNPGSVSRIYTILGEEVSQDQADQKDGVYIYYYNNGGVKKITNFK
jgi:hypothetical protein